jgi:hypothetical protein
LALVIYKDSALTDAVGVGNPIRTTHPIGGSAQVVQLWLANDDATKRYESIVLTPSDTSGADESSWIQLSPDGVTYGAAGAPLAIADIADTLGHTFYVRVTSAAVADSQNKTDISLEIIDAREYAA